GVYLQFR
ncbi:diguanylate cyclase domain protein, partial [Vibrio parahaemolyticus V-223/04]